MRALLVDDQDLVRDGFALNLALVQPDLEIVTARNVDEARRKLAAEPIAPDFIFLDLEMPTGNPAGMTFLKELKDQGSDSRIIMVSSNTGKETITEAIANGAVGWISKNTDGSDSVRRALGIILGGGVYLPQEMREKRGNPVPRSPEVVGNVLIKTVTGPEIGITAPRVYETLYHISKGVKGYRRIARLMGIEENTVDGFARTGYRTLGVNDTVSFLVLLNENGWRLAPPKSKSTKEIPSQ